MGQLNEGASLPDWTPFEEAFERLPPTASETVHKQRMAWRVRGVLQTWLNSRYAVTVYKSPLPREQGMIGPGWPEMHWLSVRSNDRSAVHDWRDLQRIKNEIIGPTHEAVELYPSEDRLVDSANQYHLFVLVNPTVQFPFGYTAREVISPEEAALASAVQRPFAPGFGGGA